jgi:hypothetical protein
MIYFYECSTDMQLLCELLNLKTDYSPCHACCHILLHPKILKQSTAGYGCTLTCLQQHTTRGFSPSDAGEIQVKTSSYIENRFVSRTCNTLATLLQSRLSNKNFYTRALFNYQHILKEAIRLKMKRFEDKCFVLGFK